MHGRGIWFTLCETEHLDRTIAGCRYDTQSGARYRRGDGFGNGSDGGGEDLGCGT